MDDEHPRYLMVDGRRWRKSDPAIPDALRSELVSELMSARRSVGAALKAGDVDAEGLARERVQDAKVALGERGRAWWLDFDEEAFQVRLAATIRTLLRKRGPPKTICPRDAARICGGEHWRERMDNARAVAWQLVDDGWLDVTKAGKPVRPPVKGPIRLRQRQD